MKKEIRYKLTDQNMKTWGGFQWELGKWAPPLDGGGDLCTEHWYHFYASASLAILLNPVHANFDQPRLFEAEVKGKSLDEGDLKEGWTEARIIKEIDIPKMSTEQRIKIIVLCVLEMYSEEEYKKWAINLLSGKDRLDSSAAKEWAADAAKWAVWATEFGVDVQKIITEVLEEK